MGRAWTKPCLAWLRCTDEINFQGRWIIGAQWRRIEQLRLEIAEVELWLAQLTVEDTQVRVLRKQAGIGLVTAWTMRAVLIEAAHRLIRLDPKWGRLATKQVLRGKPKCLAAAAVANRWVRRLFHEMRDVGASKQTA